jgi:hypothetical protein
VLFRVLGLGLGLGSGGESVSVLELCSYTISYMIPIGMSE